MSLARQYQAQWKRRDWSRIFDALPLVRGQTVLDLGCAVGDQAAELVARGARVIGFDLNEELLAAARSKGLNDADFRCGDLRALPDVEPAHGLWSSFAPAYFTDLSATLADWQRLLQPRAWIALIEIDDLFGHEPLGARARSLFEVYAKEALDQGRYDFHMGRKLAHHLERAGFEVARVWTQPDAELSFDGPALPEVVDAWRARLDRMPLLRDLGGTDFESIRDELLACMSRADHRSTAKIHGCLAHLPRA